MTCKPTASAVRQICCGTYGSFIMAIAPRARGVLVSLVTLGFSFALNASPFGACPPATYSTGFSSPESLAVSDFNDDGKSDLATANADNIAILLGNGDGSFTAPVLYEDVGGNLHSIAVADLNGDGSKDIVVAGSDFHPDPGSVHVLLGNGDGSFAAAVSLSAGDGPASVVVADIDGDGDGDLLVANQGSDTVSLLDGNGNGTFAAPVHYAVGSAPKFVVVGDFNADGRSDLAVANSFSANVSILVGNGDGTFAEAVDFHVGTGPTSLVIDDVNRDGEGDLVVTLGSEGDIGILLGNGDATFTLADPQYAAGGYPYHVVAGDFDGDGVNDLAVADNDSYWSEVLVFLGNGDGTFASAIGYAGGPYPRALAIGDFDRDGTRDLAVANMSESQVSILLGNACSRSLDFAPATYTNVGPSPFGVAGGDFNRDGNTDLAIANTAASGANDVSILLGNGSGAFTAGASYDCDVPQSVVIDDFNADGRSDLALGSPGADKVSILLGNGDGTFAAAVAYTTGDMPSSVGVDDFNGDGRRDLAVVIAGADNVSIFLGNGDGTFAASGFYSTGSVPKAVGVGDFNGDGLRDLAVANSGSDDVSILLGQGNAVFGAATPFAAGTGPQSVAVGDLNGDGRSDLVVANVDSSDVTILLGIGNGTFSAAVQYDTAGAEFVVIGDFDQDGDSDLAVTSPTLSILAGNGDGTFAAAQNFALGVSPKAVAVGDFNRDGTPDLAAANMGSNNVSILLNESSCPRITGISPAAGLTSGTQNVTISGTGLANATAVTFGGVPAAIVGTTPTSVSVTRPAHAAGIVDVLVTTTSGTGAAACGYTYADIPVAPADVTATAQGSTVVVVSWTAVPGATSYEIDRRDGASFTQIGTSTTNYYYDFEAQAETAYLYRVRAVNAVGESGHSASDLATTVLFTDSPPVATTKVKAVHLSQLRSAVSAVRVLAGLSTASFTDPSTAGTTIKGVHISELRASLDQALTTLGLAGGGYTDSSLPGVSVKAVHFEQLRDRVD